MKKVPTLFNYRRHLSDIIGYFLIFLFLCGCHHDGGVRKGVPSQGISAISRIALIPFQVIVPTTQDARMLSCPLCNAVFQADHDTQPSAGGILQEMVLENLRGQTSLSIVSPAEAAEAYERAAVDRRRNLTEVLKETAKEVGAEAILVGYVFRYRELKGRAYAAEKPASAAFELHLVSAGDGAVLWSGAFDWTQQSLMENLSQLPFIFKWGLKWVTAQELSKYGMAEIMKTFPIRR